MTHKRMNKVMDVLRRRFLCLKRVMFRVNEGSAHLEMKTIKLEVIKVVAGIIVNNYFLPEISIKAFSIPFFFVS